MTKRVSFALVLADSSLQSYRCTNQNRAHRLEWTQPRRQGVHPRYGADHTNQYPRASEQSMAKVLTGPVRGSQSNPPLQPPVRH